MPTHAPFAPASKAPLSLPFAKLIPGGNATILLKEPDIVPETLPDLSAKLMTAMHLQAEQVGALYSAGKIAPFPGAKPGLPHLQMMGGEFCVNATRCAALLLARREAPFVSEDRVDRDGPAQTAEATVKTAPHPGVWTGSLSVSGMLQPLRLAVTADKELFEAALGDLHAATDCPQPENPRHHGFAQACRLYCAACVPCAPPESTCQPLKPGVSLVSMPGIRHLLVDTALHPLPTPFSSWKKASASWRRAYDLDKEEASGVVWHERLSSGHRIWPAVAVRATASEHMESACGSGSLAMALAHLATSNTTNRVPGAPHTLDILQPSGEILQVSVRLSGDGKPHQAWIAGLTSLVAQGTAYL